MFRGKYENIQEELACHCSILAAVLPGIKKQTNRWVTYGLSLWSIRSTPAMRHTGKKVFQVAVCEKYLIGCHQTHFLQVDHCEWHMVRLFLKQALRGLVLWPCSKSCPRLLAVVDSAECGFYTAQLSLDIFTVLFTAKCVTYIICLLLCIGASDSASLRKQT